MMRDIVFFQNILTPYRISFFNQLNQYNINTTTTFTVYFMRKTEKGRYWNIDLESIQCPYILGKSMYFFFLKYHFHFNPGLIVNLIKSNNEVVLMGSWNNFNVLTLAFLKRIKVINNILHIWAEANLYNERIVSKSIVIDRIRNWVFNSIDGKFLVPGEIAVMTLKSYKIKPFKHIVLPNLINDVSFNISDDEAGLRENNIKPIIVISARLNEKVKGIIRYFSALGKERMDSVIFFVLGEGNDRKLISDYITEKNLNVTLVGHVSQQEVIKYYKMANLFILPSISDPSPLSVVEAIYMRLPMLISNRCGNHVEAVRTDFNGRTFNPLDIDDVKASFDEMMLRKSNWSQMGLNSRAIASLNFSNQKIIKNLIKSI